MKPPITLTNHPHARTAVEIESGFSASGYYECFFIPSVNSLECYQCGKSRQAHDGLNNVFATIAKHFAIAPGKPIARPEEVDTATERD